MITGLDHVQVAAPPGCGVAEEFAPARKGHPGLAVDDLDAHAARLAAAGAPVRWDDRLPGCRRFYTDDPWGNRLELLARDRP